MASKSKTILIDGRATKVKPSYLGEAVVWLKARGVIHVVPRNFWDGTTRAYKEPVGGPDYQRIEGDEEPSDLIQRIEYVLHSGYDATDRELLREALAALKEKA